VKDVCPIVGVEVGARVRAHFYYENGQKSKSWREAQVQKPREIGFPYTFGCEGNGVGGVRVSLCKGGHETRASKLANLFFVHNIRIQSQKTF